MPFTEKRVDEKKVTHVALLWFAVGTLLAFSYEYREYMVPWCQLCYSLTHAFHNLSIYINHHSLGRAVQIIRKFVKEEKNEINHENEQKLD
jgi:hypothetical protein